MGIGEWIKRLLGIRSGGMDICDFVHRAVTEGIITYRGGDGSSPDEPVIIEGAQWDLIGTAAAFEWLIRSFGAMGIGWHSQGHASGEWDGRRIDTFHIRLASGETRHVYFDVTESYGKHPDDAPPQIDGE
jgi:hypothetical protein